MPPRLWSRGSRPASRSRLPVLQAYVATVTIAGLGLLVLLGGRGGWTHLLQRDSPAVWVFIALIVVGELRPVRGLLPGSDEITISTPFAFALLLTEGTGAGVVALAAASTIADLLARKPLSRLTFNVAQCTLALAAGGAVLTGLSSGPEFATDPQLTLGDFPPLLLAGVMFFIVNNTLTGVAVALHQRQPVLRFLGRDFGFQLFTAVVLIGLAPIVVVSAERSLVLIPLLLLPLIAVYRAARVSLERDYAASHDALTDLPNRTLFRERGRAEIEQAQRTQSHVAVLLLDLNHFKEVNDTLGHHVGDQLLQQVGPRLAAAGGSQATVARLGGDEFGLLLPGELLHGMERTCGLVLAAFEEPFVVQGFSLEVEASMGVALYPEHGAGVETLMQRADIAMYQAKDRHLGFEVYVQERDRYSRRRLQLVGELRRGIDEQQLFLHYQPIVSLETGHFVGVEALVRWRHPKHGVLPPDEFIPLAERTGLIGPLTLYVLEAALKQCSAWGLAGLELGVAVNLSVRNLYDAAFPAHVKRLLTAYGVDPILLKLEITESLVMADPPRAQRVLEELSDLGLRLSIDDFGTGYTSLALLKQLPVHEVKIDRSFVMHMISDKGDAVIVQSIIDLARNLRMAVVAEGVESEEILIELGHLGCDLAQGFYLGRGLPADEVVGIVARPLPPSSLGRPRTTEHARELASGRLITATGTRTRERPRS